MGPTPLIAPYRIIFQYTVDFLIHKQTFYLDCTPSADASGFDTLARSGFSNVGVSTLMDSWFNLHKTFYDDADTTFDTWVLEIMVAGAWVFVASGVCAVAPTGTGTYAKAGMEAWAGKDTANRPFPVYFYEKFFPGFSKTNSVGALSGDNQTISNALFNTLGSAGGDSPVAWRRSRGNLFSQRWLSLVTDSNQKLRRIRNIA